MKQFSSLLLLICVWLPLQTWGQTLPTKGTLSRTAAEQPARVSLGEPSTRVVGCGIDTSDYAFFKAVDSAAVLVDIFEISANGLSRVGQWYDAPSPVNIHGMDFFASAAGPIDVTATIYNAGPDSLPTGAPIFDFTFPLSPDTNLIAYSLTFGTPVTVNGPYILAIENTNPQAAGIACSEWTEQEGLQEWLGVAGAAAFWLRPYDVTLDNNLPFDGDALILPHVSYEYDFDFEATPTDCFAFGNDVSFDSDISPIFFSRFYNRLFNPLSAFFSPDTAFIWYFGDGDSSFMANPTHTYGTPTPVPDSFTVELLGQVVGYRGFCPIDLEQRKYPAGPPASLSVTAAAGATEGTFDFDLTAEAETWYWNFGDGTPLVFNDLTPSHTYTTFGTYTVQVIGSGCNTTDTATVDVSYINTAISQAELPSSLQIGPNPVQDQLRIQALDRITQLNLELVNLQGKRVWKAQEMDMVAGQVRIMDVSSLASGMYWLQVQSANAQGGMMLQIQ